MKVRTFVDLDQSTLSVDAHGDEVRVRVNDIYTPGSAEARLHPHQAVQLSRALVKAAAEALGVKQEGEE